MSISELGSIGDDLRDLLLDTKREIDRNTDDSRARDREERLRKPCIRDFARRSQTSRKRIRRAEGVARQFRWDGASVRMESATALGGMIVAAD